MASLNFTNDSESFASEAWAADLDRWICFDGEPHEIDDWLDAFPPSKVYRSDGIGWLSVRNHTGEGMDIDDVDHDVIGLQDNWHRLQQESRDITTADIYKLATEHNVLPGKWLFYAPSGAVVNHMWSIVAKATVEGRLGISAKVSPYYEQSSCGYDANHVVCIYNNDLTNQEEILFLEKAIRDAGIYAHLSYKPDVFTYIGIYRSNKWGIRPTVLQSDFDLETRRSIIKDTSTNTVIQN